jgi:hypothetical protein
MSIHNKIQIIKRVDAIVTELKLKYPRDTAAFPELTKLGESLDQLVSYLSHLDQLQPNYTTNEIDKYVLAINLNLDILKSELEKADYLKLLKGIKVVKTILKFHPAKYSFFEFIIIWIYEMIYYI